MMKKVKFSIMLLVGLLFGFKVNAQKANFSGTWVINENRSDFAGQAPTTMFKQLEIKQDQNELEVQGIKYGTRPDTKPTTIVYPLDGSQLTILLPNKSTMRATISWANNEKSLIRTSTYSLPDQPDTNDYSSKETWNLSVDGRELVIVREFTISQDEKIEIKAIYDKR